MINWQNYSNYFEVRLENLILRNIIVLLIRILFIVSMYSLMKFLYCLIIHLLIFSTVSAQRTIETLEKFSKDFTPERIYIHYDKSSYLAGDTLWFKTYLMKATQPAEESKTLYIEWTNDSGRLISRTVSSIIEGTSFGQFNIPEDYQGTYIHARAYTSWMRNADPAFLYNKTIKILPPRGVEAKAEKIIPELTFFPEGGSFVAGVLNKIAFKATDQWGNPINVSGIITDNQDKTIDSLRTIHDGMGYFYVTPASGESFRASWVDESGRNHITQLPGILNTGISMQIGLIGNKRSFSIRTSKDYLREDATLHVIGTMYQHMVFHFSKSVNDGKIEGIIPGSELPAGILTITVFDNNWNPLAERITYINNNPEHIFHPAVTTVKKNLERRSRNEIEIDVPDSIVSDLSISITDAAIDHNSDENIITRFLLTSELSGRVYNPSYYFQNNSDTISRKLDLVMLTNGWRRFKWKDLSAGILPKINFQKDTSYISLSGRITGLFPSEMKSAGEIGLMLTKTDTPSQFITVPIDEDGYFSDPSQVIFDTVKVFYKLPKVKRKETAEVEFIQNLPPLTSGMPEITDPPLLKQDDSSRVKHYELSKANLDELKMFKNKVLANINITVSALDVVDSKYTTGNFRDKNAVQVDLRNPPKWAISRNIYSYLIRMGVELTLVRLPESLKILYRKLEVDIFLDEVKVSPENMDLIPITDIAFVKVMKPPFIGATGFNNTAIAIYTRKGDDRPEIPGKGLSKDMVVGYTSVREFFSPDYAIKKDAAYDDFRTTLYWNPEIITDKENNKIPITFYNNDVSKSFKVIIEGMTKSGKLAHVEQTIE